MTTLNIRVHDFLKDRILVSRESARSLECTLRQLFDREPSSANGLSSHSVSIDFTHIEGLAPSFMDELISVLESVLKDLGSNLRLMVVNPPTRLSLKFQAIARGHGMSAQLLPDGSWLLAIEPKPES